MASKKNNHRDLPTVPEISAAPEDTIESTPLYTVGRWKGLPHYKCELCKFSTLNEGAMAEHIEKRHMDPLRPQLNPGPAPEGDSGNTEEVVEVELREISSTVDAEGVEHKKFEIKE
jgi:hypothetical protein